MDILRQIKNITEQYADKPFIIDSLNDITISFKDLVTYSCNLSFALREHGVSSGDAIAILLTNSLEFVVAYFSCLYGGYVAVPINTMLTQKEQESILHATGARLILYSLQTSDSLARIGFDPRTVVPVLIRRHKDNDAAQDNKEKCILFEELSSVIPSGWRPFEGISSRNTFSIHFTSGTTSRPKGVMHRIQTLFGNALAFNKEHSITYENIFLHIMPMGYMAGFLNTLLCPFIAGAQVVMAQQFDARSVLRFWKPIMKHKADTIWLSPTMLSSLIHIDREPSAADYCRQVVKKIFVGTAPLPLKLKNDFEKKYSIEVFESYGLSELLLISANSDRYPRVKGSVGRPLSDVDVRIYDEELQILPVGADGEIYVKTPYMAVGYLEHEAVMSNSKNPNGWFPTGDIGHLDQEGNIFVTDRKKDLIIRGGFNISPVSIEEILITHSAVEQVAVIGLPHEFYGEEVVAVIKFKQGYDLASELGTLKKLCTENLNSNAVPTRFIEFHPFPVNTTGKIQKSKLKEILLQERESL